MWRLVQATLLVAVFAVAFSSALRDGPDCAELARDPDGCDFYPKCLEATSPCGANGYAMGYGDKYCVRFGTYSDTFNAYGQDWIKRVRSCLKTKIYNDTAVYNSHNCDLIKKTAFVTHPECYVSSGFCDMVKSLQNLNALTKVFDVSDFFSKEALSQVYETLNCCLSGQSHCSQKLI